jgi:hypothetical protein
MTYGSSVYTTTGTTALSDPWPYWVATNSTSMTTANTILVSNPVTSAYTWGAWNANYATSAVTTTGTINGNGPYYLSGEGLWVTWNGTYFENAVIAAVPAPTIAAVPSKPAPNRVKAKRLLKSLLTDEQEAALEEKGSFDLTIGDRIYRVSPGRGVTRIGADGKADESYCIHPDGSLGLPIEDWAIAQKLLLETDEEAFLRIANKTRLRA